MDNKAAAANPVIALWLQSTRPTGRLAELGSSFDGLSVMTITEILLLVLCLAVVVVGGLAGLQAFEQRRARRLVAPLVTRICPECNHAFGAEVLSTARHMHGFVDPPSGKSLAAIGPIPPRVSVECPKCSTRWEFCDGELSKIPVLH